MRKTLLLMALLTTMTAMTQEQSPMLLQYDKPAAYFEESLPIGNGKLGALVYGGTDDNIIYLNDITLWTGKPVDKNIDADSLQHHVQGPNSQYYQPLGTLHIKDLSLGAVSDYHRSLSLDSSIVKDSYLRDGRIIEREYFASNPDHLIAIRLRGDINCRIALTALMHNQVNTIPSQLKITG